jgi:hypothetical protein
MVFKGKRGKSALAMLFFALFTIILGGLFIIMVLGKVKSAVADNSFYKKFYSRDLGLLVDSMHSANGNMVFSYDVMTKKGAALDMTLQQDRVTLTDHSDAPIEQRMPTSFLFARSSDVNISVSTTGPSPLSFQLVMANRTISFSGNSPSQAASAQSPQ